MKLENEKSKEVILQRLRRIEGQLRGVQGMVTSERDCGEIIQQLTSIRSAVQSASVYLLQEHATECILNREYDQKEREDLVKSLSSLLRNNP